MSHMSLNYTPARLSKMGLTSDFTIAVFLEFVVFLSHAPVFCGLEGGRAAFLASHALVDTGSSSYCTVIYFGKGIPDTIYCHYVCFGQTTGVGSTSDNHA